MLHAITDSVLPCDRSWCFLQHSFKLLTSQRVRSVMRCSDIESLQSYDFPGILKERVPGTPGHDKVRQVSGSTDTWQASCNTAMHAHVVHSVTFESTQLLSLEHH